VRVLPLVLLLSACGHSDPEPRHGGAPFRLRGDYAELVVHASGEIHVYAPPQAGISVVIDGDAIALRYADAIQGYVGFAPHPLSAGTVDVMRITEGRLDRTDVHLESVLPAPTHDGSIVSVGERIVEVVVHADGSACAHLSGEAEVMISVEGTEGQMHPIPLGQSHCGQLLGLSPRAGPLQVILRVDDRAHIGEGTLRTIAKSSPR
jgi:hypothetical protein